MDSSFTRVLMWPDTQSASNTYFSYFWQGLGLCDKSNLAACVETCEIYATRISVRHNNLCTLPTNPIGFWYATSLNLCWYISKANWIPSHIITLMMELKSVSETLVYLNHMTWQSAQEGLIVFYVVFVNVSHKKSYWIVNIM